MVKFTVIKLVINVVYNSSHDKILKAQLYINECRSHARRVVDIFISFL